LNGTRPNPEDPPGAADAPDGPSGSRYGCRGRTGCTATFESHSPRGRATPTASPSLPSAWLSRETNGSLSVTARAIRASSSARRLKTGAMPPRACTKDADGLPLYVGSNAKTGHRLRDDRDWLMRAEAEELRNPLDAQLAR